MSVLITTITRIYPIIALGAFLIFLSMAIFSYNPRAATFGTMMTIFISIGWAIYFAKEDVDAGIFEDDFENE